MSIVMCEGENLERPSSWPRGSIPGSLGESLRSERAMLLLLLSRHQADNQALWDLPKCISTTLSPNITT